MRIKVFPKKKVYKPYERWNDPGDTPHLDLRVTPCQAKLLRQSIEADIQTNGDRCDVMRVMVAIPSHCREPVNGERIEVSFEGECWGEFFVENSAFPISLKHLTEYHAVRMGYDRVTRSCKKSEAIQDWLAMHPEEDDETPLVWVFLLRPGSLKTP